MSEDASVIECAKCTLCKGAGFQSPPMLYAGNKFADVLIIGQNPGALKPQDEPRLYAAKLMNSYMSTHIDTVSSDLVSFWYHWDLGYSPGAKSLAKVFGEGWLDNNKFCFTNAVRCRTEGNAAPSAEMVANCKRYTKRFLFGRKLVVLMGGVARNQVWAGEELPSQGKIVKNATYGNVMILPHYVTWKNDIQVERWAEEFKKFKESL